MPRMLRTPIRLKVVYVDCGSAEDEAGTAVALRIPSAVSNHPTSTAEASFCLSRCAANEGLSITYLYKTSYLVYQTKRS